MSEIGRNAPCPCGSGKKHKKCCIAELPRIAVCTPMRDTPCSEYVQALKRDRQHFQIIYLTEVGRPVMEARNALARRALESKCEYVAWIDDDAWWPHGTFKRILALMQARPEVDLVAGYFCGRDHFAPPFAWFKWNDVDSMVDAGRNAPLGSLVRVEQAGFHFVVMRRAVLLALGPDPFTLIDQAWTEDFSFIARAVFQHGMRLYVDTGSWIAHIGDRGDAFMVGAPRGRIINGELSLPKRSPIPSGPRTLEAERAYGLPTYGVQ